MEQPPFSLSTAKDFAAAAARARMLAEELRTTDKDPFYESRTLAVFQLRNAAQKMQEISEALAQREGILKP